MKSQKHSDINYFFNIKWPQIGFNLREVDKMKQQKYELEMKISQHEKKIRVLIEDKEMLEQSRIMPYEMQYTEIKDESMLEQMNELFNNQSE